MAELLDHNLHKTAPWIALRRLPAGGPTPFEVLIVRRHTGISLNRSSWL